MKLFTPILALGLLVAPSFAQAADTPYQISCPTKSGEEATITDAFLNSARTALGVPTDLFKVKLSVRLQMTGKPEAQKVEMTSNQYGYAVTANEDHTFNLTPVSSDNLLCTYHANVIITVTGTDSQANKVTKKTTKPIGYAIVRRFTGKVSKH